MEFKILTLDLQLARQYSSGMENILQAYSDIGDVLPRMHKIKLAFKNDDEGLRTIIAQIYLDILKFHKRAYKLFRRRAWFIWYTIDLGRFNSQFTSIIDSLKKNCDLLDKEAAATHFVEMAKARDAHEEREEKLERSEEIRMAREVFSWLSAAEKSQEDYLHVLAERRHPDTCSWLIDDEQIYPWIGDAQSNPVIWLTGKPGAGKSICASFLVQHLQTFEDKTCLYYFCSHGSSENDLSESESCELILRTFAAQLLLHKHNQELIPLVHQAYIATLDSTYVATSSKPSAKITKRLLKDVLETVGSTRIVLDGIDECPKAVQREVLCTIRALQKQAGDDCKLIVSSRHEPQIDKEMSCSIPIPMDGRTSDAINKYIEYSVMGNGSNTAAEIVKMEDEERTERHQSLKERFPEYPEDLFVKATQMLLEKAKGMFLWVRLVIKMLEQSGSEFEFEKAIEELPDGLDEAYGRILLRISKEDTKPKNRAMRILSWLCYAYRPVQSYELVDGIALTPGQTILSKKTISQNLKRDVLDICAPLIEKTPYGTLDLVHFSAKEYLLDPRSGLNPRGAPFVDPKEAHFSIAFACVTNLDTATEVIQRFPNGLSDLELEKAVIQGRYGLQPYGHDFWAEHVSAYLEKATLEEQQSRSLLTALELLSRVLKGDTSQWDVSAVEQPRAYPGLQKLHSCPKLFVFITKWLNFKSKQPNSEEDNSDFVAQRDWHLRKDETYLSLMQTRLEEIAERLLAMDPYNLPDHLDRKDYDTFISRHGFICRFFDCEHRCNSLDERETHERSHIPSFVCPDCDFSERGFRTNSDLNRHRRLYHMSPEDFKVPNSLEFDSIKKPTRSSPWNEEGRRVLKQSFTRVMQSLKPKLSSAEADIHPNKTESNGATPQKKNVSRDLSWIEDSPADLRNIWDKINGEKYQTLKEFKSDLCKLVDNRENDVALSIDEVRTICTREIDKVTAKVPSFRNANKAIHLPISTYATERIPPHYQPKVEETWSASGKREDLPDVHEFEFPDRKEPYWSKLEDKELPKLLERVGRNFLEIAKHLKTKNPSQVEEHFMSLINGGRDDLLRLADAADARLEPDPEPVHELDDPQLATDVEDELQATVSYPREEVERSMQNDPRDKAELPEDFLVKKKKRSAPENENDDLEGREKVEGTAKKKQKRSKPPEVQCDECHEKLIGYDGMIRHKRRRHLETRTVWRCEDPDREGTTLENCKPCKKPKGYTTFPMAAKHLIKQHDFEEDTTPETFAKWITKHKEYNPSYESVKNKNKRPAPVPAPAPAPAPALAPIVENGISSDQWESTESNNNYFDLDSVAWQPSDAYTQHLNPWPPLLDGTFPFSEESLPADDYMYQTPGYSTLDVSNRPWLL